MISTNRGGTIAVQVKLWPTTFRVRRERSGLQPASTPICQATLKRVNAALRPQFFRNRSGPLMLEVESMQVRHDSPAPRCRGVRFEVSGNDSSGPRLCPAPAGPVAEASPIRTLGNWCGSCSTCCCLFFAVFAVVPVARALRGFSGARVSHPQQLRLERGCGMFRTAGAGDALRLRQPRSLVAAAPLCVLLRLFEPPDQSSIEVPVAPGIAGWVFV
jgi:hypothetical protein